MAIVLCCLASGLAYISGGVLLASLGAAAFVAYRRHSPTLTRTALLVLGMGVALFALQFALVTLQQGSLMEHSHRAETVFPTDRRFWIFFVALFGRALGYRGLFFRRRCALRGGRAGARGRDRLLRELRGSATDTGMPRLWSLLALYAGLGAGNLCGDRRLRRAGFAADTAAAEHDHLDGQAALPFLAHRDDDPVCVAGMDSVRESLAALRARAVAAAMAIVLVAPKSLSTFDNASRLREIAVREREGARCVVAHLTDMEAGRRWCAKC